MISFGGLILIQIKQFSHRNHQHQEVERSGAALLATKAGFAFGTSWAWIKVEPRRLNRIIARRTRYNQYLLIKRSFILSGVALGL